MKTAEILTSHGQSVARQIPGTIAEQSASLSYTLPILPLFVSAERFASQNPQKLAVIDDSKASEFTYAQLLHDTCILKNKIEARLKDLVDLEVEARIAFLVPAGYDYVVTQWAVWAASAIAVPLCTTHPVKELLYTLSDSDPALVFIHPSFALVGNELRSAASHVTFVNLDPHEQLESTPQLPQVTTTISLSRRALMIYTSGTTSQPKGCVTTHQNITSQAASLIEAWKYTQDDRLIHVLPLHHIHGIINGLTAMLLAGGTVEMHSKFDAEAVWDRWMSIGSSTMFMAVPTVYSRLIDYFDSNIRGSPSESRAREGAKILRVMISGSAALPIPIKSSFREITGQELLERYGMTEIGMALSCGLQVNKRIDGSVGWPLPGVHVRLVESDGTPIEDADREGLIEVKGDTVFLEYWRMPEMTTKEFSSDRWFKTGDVAKRDASGAYFIQGRASVDIIKSGGYKISALEVERHILSLQNISEVAVVGIDDAEWGQRVAALVTQKPGTPDIELGEFRAQLKAEIAPYKIPTVLKVVDRIERNAMGKVNKKEIVRQHF